MSVCPSYEPQDHTGELFIDFISLIPSIQCPCDASIFELNHNSELLINIGLKTRQCHFNDNMGLCPIFM